jgi:hypothetical protein
MKAECQCGQLSIKLSQATPVVVACHCVDCQRRTGAPFGVLAFYPAYELAVTGESKRFGRSTATGGVFETFFCPECGSTVYAKSGKHPTMIGIAVGAIADPNFPAPVRSVWERSRHHWVTIAGDVEHFPEGRS